MLLGSLPIATIDSTAPWLELLDNVVLLLQGMVSDQWDCDMVLASSFPAAFINTIVLSSIGPEPHAIPSNSLISSGPLCSSPCHAIHSLHKYLRSISNRPGKLRPYSQVVRFSSGPSNPHTLNWSPACAFIQGRKRSSIIGHYKINFLRFMKIVNLRRFTACPNVLLWPWHRTGLAWNGSHIRAGCLPSCLWSLPRPN